MTDGQEFYIILALFYGFSCFKLALPRSVGVSKLFFRGWSLRSPLMFLGGINKILFLAPVLPWPSVMVVAEYPPALDQGESQVDRITHSSRIRLIRLVDKASVDLRLFSFYLWILFFGMVPYFYSTEGASVRTLTAILLCFVLTVIIGLRFFFIHRRFEPLCKAERYKHFLLALLMPWHAMRLSDELFNSQRLRHIHPIALASMSKNPKGRAWIGKKVREARFLKNPQYPESEVLCVCHGVGINPERYFDLPTKNDDDASLFCPCCHATYASSVDIRECVDCDGVLLHEFPKSA